MMISLFLSAVFLAAQPASQAAPETLPELNTENRAIIRCTAAFALVGARQARDGGNSEWPELKTRGREFFVVALAGIMDERGISRETIARLVRAEAVRLNDAKEVDAVMPACLLMLQTSGI